MNVLSLQCKSCGAPLEFSARATHVRCRYCSSLMLVRQRDNIASLDIVEQGKAVDAIVAADSNMIELKQQLHDLDHRWLEERDRMLRDLNHQTFRMVGKADFAGVGILAIVVMAACSIATWFAGASGLIFMVLVGVVPVVFFIGRGGLNPFDSAHYLRRRAEYENRRSGLIDQIRGRFKAEGIDSEEVDLMPGNRAVAVKE